MDTDGLSSLEIPNSILTSSPPPTLLLSAKAWGTLLVETGAKTAWSTSALPVSTVTKSPASIVVFFEN